MTYNSNEQNDDNHVDMLENICFFINVFSVCQPAFLGHIIALFEPGASSDESHRLGIFYGIGLVFTVALKTFGFTAYDMLTTHMGMKMRVSTCFLIYNKVPLWSFSS